MFIFPAKCAVKRKMTKPVNTEICIFIDQRRYLYRIYIHITFTIQIPHWNWSIFNGFCSCTSILMKVQGNSILNLLNRRVFWSTALLDRSLRAYRVHCVQLIAVGRLTSVYFECVVLTSDEQDRLSLNPTRSDETDFQTRPDETLRFFKPEPTRPELKKLKADPTRPEKFFQWNNGILEKF